MTEKVKIKRAGKLLFNLGDSIESQIPRGHTITSVRSALGK